MAGVYYPSNQHILITGAAGFIGAHLGNRLVALGNKVRGIDNFYHSSGQKLDFRCETGDVRDEAHLSFVAKDSDMVVHLAAVISIDNSIEFPENCLDINTTGTMRVLEIARRFDMKVVFASSSEVYGPTQATSMDESHPLDAQSPYAATKVFGDRLCNAYKETYGMSINTVRLFNTFGPHQASDGYGGVIAKFTRQTLDGESMTIYGDGSQERDYLYVSDAVEAYLLAMTQEWDGPVNFASGNPVSILDIARKIESLTYIHSPRPKSDSPKNVWEFSKPRPADIRKLWGNSDKARREVGWEPKIAFDDGLRMYVDWAVNEKNYPQNLRSIPAHV